jgi:hypothetical protein
VNAITFPLRLVARLSLAAKFYGQLGYSWHLAWVKSAR